MLFRRQLFSSNSHWCAFFISRNQSITRLISFQKNDEKTTVFRDQCFQEFGPRRELRKVEEEQLRFQNIIQQSGIDSIVAGHCLGECCVNNSIHNFTRQKQIECDHLLRCVRSKVYVHVSLISE
jgi:hypothetical protein